MADVFVSYAREDRPFVESMTRALEARGLEVWVDVEGLYVGEKFWERICSEIESAAAIVYVVSEHSARSRYCRREAEHAAAQSKRIVPVVIDQVHAEHHPKPIRSRHWLSFTDEGRFEPGIDELVEAVERDLDWVHSHTRLLLLAREWEARGRTSTACLRGGELSEAVAWLARASTKEPAVAELQIEFIRASQQEESSAREDAERRERIARSRALTSQAELLLTSRGGSSLIAALLASEALRCHVWPDAQSVLCRALAFLPPWIARFEHESRIAALRFSPDGKHLATAAGMTLQEEMNREYVSSATGPSLEDVDPHSAGMRRLAEEGEAGQSGAWNAILWNLANGREQVRLPHGGRVRALAFAPDGERLATASEDGRTTVWSMPSGELLTSFEHQGPAWFVEITEDGSRVIAIAEEDPNSLGQLTARVWSIASGKEFARISLGGIETGGNALRREMTAYALCLKAELLAAAFVDGTIRVFDLSDGHIVATHEYPPTVHALAFDFGGSLLAIGADPDAHIARVADGQVLATLPHNAGVGLLRWGPRGDRLVSASGGGATPICDTVRVWGVDGSLIDRFEYIHVRDLTFSPDGELIAVAGSSGQVRIRDADGRRGDIAHLHFEDAVNAVVFSRSGDEIAAAADDHTVRAWRAKFGIEVLRSLIEGRGSPAQLSSDGRLVALGGGAGCRVIDTKTGKRLAELPGETWEIVFSPDNSCLALCSSQDVRLWRWSRDECVSLKHSHVRTVAISPDNSRLVTLGPDDQIGKGVARIWDILSGRQIADVKHNDVPVATISPDGKRLASAGGPYSGGEVLITSLDDGRLLTVARIGAPVNALDFSPDGRWLAVAYHELGLYVFDSGTGEQLAKIGPEQQACLFSPVGDLLIAASEIYRQGRPRVSVTIYDVSHLAENRQARDCGRLLEEDSLLGLRYLEHGAYLATVGRSSVGIWNTATWREAARYEIDDGRVSFSDEGGLLAFFNTTNGDCELRVVPWRSEDLLDETRKRVTRELTREELSRYVGDESDALASTNAQENGDKLGS